MTKPEIQAAGGDTATPLNLQKRLDWICAVAGPVRGKSVIDCGCGAGEYVRALTALGADAWGIEYSAEKIGDAKLGEPCPKGAWRSEISRPSSSPTIASMSRCSTKSSSMCPETIRESGRCIGF